MALRTLENLIADLNSRIGDESLEQDVATRWLQLGWQDSLDYYDWPFMKASATGTLASDTSDQTFSSVFSVTDFRRMVQLLVGTTEYSRIDWQDKDISSQSQVYAILPDLTGLMLPGSDGGSSTLKYIKEVQEISTGQTVAAPTASTTAVPSQYGKNFEEATLAAAAHRYFQNSLKPGMADYWIAQRNFYLDIVLDQIKRMSENDVIAFRAVDYNDSGDDAY